MSVRHSAPKPTRYTRGWILLSDLFPSTHGPISSILILYTVGFKHTAPHINRPCPLIVTPSIDPHPPSRIVGLTRLGESSQTVSPLTSQHRLTQRNHHFPTGRKVCLDRRSFFVVYIEIYKVAPPLPESGADIPLQQRITPCILNQVLPWHLLKSRRLLCCQPKPNRAFRMTRRSPCNRSTTVRLRPSTERSCLPLLTRAQ